MSNEVVLYTRMEMRLNDAEKKLAKFQKDVDRKMSGIDQSTKRAAHNMEASMSSSAAKIGAVFKGFGTGLLAGFAAGGISGIVGSLRDVASGVADIGAEAERAGISAKSFQELRFVAEQNRVSVDALTDGMKELSLRTDEFIISGGKTGSAAQAFQRLGFSVADLKAKIKDPSALLTEIIGKVQKLDKAAQVRIFDELFGGEGGEQFVRLIDQGEAGIRDQIKAANDLGIVLNDEVIAKATEVDRQFNLIATTIGSRLKKAIVDAFSALSQFVDAYRSVQDQANVTLDTQISDLGRERLDIERKILEARERQDELARAGMLNPLAKASTGQDLKNYQQQLDAIASKEKTLVEERNKRVNLNPLPALNAGDGGGDYGGGLPPAQTSTSKSTYERETEQIRDRTSALNAETQAAASLCGKMFIL